MITLQETSDSYLLTVPYYQRERAKAIDGRWWDRNRKCWVYPRRRDTYEALIAEFGEELRGHVPGPPTEKRSDKKLDSEKLAAIYAKLVGAKPETDEDLDARVTDLEETLATVTAERNQLRTDHEKLRQSLAENQREPEENILPQVGRVAAETCGDPTLEDAARRSRDGATLVMELGRMVELRLRTLVNVDEGATFYDLLTVVRDQGVLSKEAWGLAQTLRTLRNVATHLETEPSTDTSRCLVALLATGIVLRELPPRA